MQAIPAAVLESAGKWRDTTSPVRKKVMRLVRQKLKDAVEALIMGETRMFHCVKNGPFILDADGKASDIVGFFEKKGEKDGWYYTHLECYAEADGYGFFDYFEACDYNIVFTAFYALVDDDMHLVCESEEEVRALAQEYASYNGTFYDLEGDEKDAFLDDTVAFAHAIHHAVEGKIEEALSCERFSLFCSLVTDFFDGNVSERYVAANLPYFHPAVIPGGITYRITIIGSKELYAYETYKENLPESVREEAERMIALYRFPFCDEPADGLLYTDHFLNEDEGREVVLFGMYDTGYEASPFEESYHPLYELVAGWLMEELPKLRKEYGAQTGAPALFLTI